MENLSLAQILERMDQRTEQIAQIISNQTTALENIARISDVFAQSLTAISQRQIIAMEQQAHALEVSAQALRISSEILKRIEEER